MCLLLVGCGMPDNSEHATDISDATAAPQGTILPSLRGDTPTPVETIAPCAVSRTQTISPQLPPMIGAFPFWFVGTSTISWSTMTPLKTGARATNQFWVVDTQVPGDLRVTARRIAGGEASNNGSQVLFVWYGATETPVMIRTNVEQPYHDVPAPPQSAPGYQAHSDTVRYPSPGCYLFTAEIASYTVEVTIQIT